MLNELAELNLLLLEKIYATFDTKADRVAKNFRFQVYKYLRPKAMVVVDAPEELMKKWQEKLDLENVSENPELEGEGEGEDDGEKVEDDPEKLAELAALAAKKAAEEELARQNAIFEGASFIEEMETNESCDIIPGENTEPIQGEPESDNPKEKGGEADTFKKGGRVQCDIRGNPLFSPEAIKKAEEDKRKAQEE